MPHRYSDRVLDAKVKALIRAAQAPIWQALGIPEGNSGRPKLKWAKKAQLVAIVRLAEILQQAAGEAHAVLSDRQQKEDENSYHRDLETA